MLVMHKRSCSWLLLVAVGSVVVLICLAQFSLSPWGSTRNYFSVKQAQTTCIPHNIQASQSGLSLSCRFPADLHKAVVYHGAPWKAEIGQWLLGCDSVVNEISITEVLISSTI